MGQQGAKEQRGDALPTPIPALFCLPQINPFKARGGAEQQRGDALPTPPTTRLFALQQQRAHLGGLRGRGALSNPKCDALPTSHPTLYCPPSSSPLTPTLVGWRAEGQGALRDPKCDTLPTSHPPTLLPSQRQP